MIKLKKILRDIGQSQASLARACNASPSAIAQLCNHGQMPKTEGFNEAVTQFLKAHRATDLDWQNEFKKVDLTRCTAPGPDHRSNQSYEDEDMLLRKQTLTQAARKQFGLFKDPFCELQSDDDMWISQDIRYVREYMYQTAKHGGFLAVIGESGAGKTTVRRSLEQRIQDEHLPIVLIQPYVLAAEDNDTKGKTLKSTHIAEAILAAVAPLERPKNSPEARFAQLHKVLKDSHKSGYKHCLIIEEAHSLPIPTLKHLKRIYELESGYTKLLSIILIGQPELLGKLSERNAEVREIVQRCEVATLTPIDVASLGDFINHRLGRAGKRPISSTIPASPRL
jgi:type II secretory pathway predicted ATPase ExeA